MEHVIGDDRAGFDRFRGKKGRFGSRFGDRFDKPRYCNVTRGATEGKKTSTGPPL